MTDKACEVAPTEDVRMGHEHGQKCIHCGDWVRDDLMDHFFFGFKAGCLLISTAMDARPLPSKLP